MVYCYYDNKISKYEGGVMQVYDTVFQIRVNSKVLESAKEYSTKSGMNLSEELRKVLEKMDRLNRKRE